MKKVIRLELNRLSEKLYGASSKWQKLIKRDEFKEYSPDLDKYIEMTPESMFAFMVHHEEMIKLKFLKQNQEDNYYFALAYVLVEQGARYVVPVKKGDSDLFQTLPHHVKTLISDNMSDDEISMDFDHFVQDCDFVVKNTEEAKSIFNSIMLDLDTEIFQYNPDKHKWPRRNHLSVINTIYGAI